MVDGLGREMGLVRRWVEGTQRVHNAYIRQVNFLQLIYIGWR